MPENSIAVSTERVLMLVSDYVLPMLRDRFSEDCPAALWAEAHLTAESIAALLPGDFNADVSDKEIVTLLAGSNFHHGLIEDLYQERVALLRRGMFPFFRKGVSR